ncbi:hypothetical protein O3P69_001782 [Scylla paramamosain]|uniref:Uncharacterized protein n=1 Tax=Scylla paramamosain TaxID=85552 RepID=A0AAW0V0R8_SCYPA
MLFGEDDDNPTMPSLEMLQKLKKSIDIDLTIKRFIDYRMVVDIKTAELYMKDKSVLENICRQQVMSNPLLSSLYYDNSVPKNYNKSKKKIFMSGSPLEDELDSASIVSEKDAVAITAAASVVVTPELILYQELTDILTNSSKNTDPATRLTNKISFLKKMLAFKIGNMCNMSKMLNLSSFIVIATIEDQIFQTPFGPVLVSDDDEKIEVDKTSTVLVQVESYSSNVPLTDKEYLSAKAENKMRFLSLIILRAVMGVGKRLERSDKWIFYVTIDNEERVGMKKCEDVLEDSAEFIALCTPVTDEDMQLEFVVCWVL